MVAIEYVHLNVSDQHALVFPGLPGKADVEVFAEKASPSVCARHIPGHDLLAKTAAHEGGGHIFAMLLYVD